MLTHSQRAVESQALINCDVTLTETFVPARLLYGLMPAALLETHRFWQDQEDNMRGYPIKEDDKSGIVRVTLERQPLVDCTHVAGVTARVSKELDGQTVVLGNLLHARPHTPLANVLAVLSKIECVSHILAWCSPASNSSAPRLVRVELPRLNLAFQELTVGGTRRLYSIDHANLFVPFFAYGGPPVRLFFRSCVFVSVYVCVCSFASSFKKRLHESFSLPAFRHR
jgi:hypothetical protein